MQTFFGIGKVDELIGHWLSNEDTLIKGELIFWHHPVSASPFTHSFLPNKSDIKNNNDAFTHHIRTDDTFKHKNQQGTKKGGEAKTSLAPPVSLSVSPHGLCSAWTCQCSARWWKAGRCRPGRLGPSTRRRRPWPGHRCGPSSCRGRGRARPETAAGEGTRRSSVSQGTVWRGGGGKGGGVGVIDQRFSPLGFQCMHLFRMQNWTWSFQWLIH